MGIDPLEQAAFVNVKRIGLVHLSNSSFTGVSEIIHPAAPICLNNSDLHSIYL